MMGNGSLNIVLAFSNVSRTQEMISATFQENIDFWCENMSFLVFFRTKNQHFSKKTALIISCVRDTLEKAKTMFKLPFPIIQWHIMTYYLLPPFIYTKNHFFQSHKMSFSALMASKGQQVLTKKSTCVDQNIRSDKVMSQLSLATFVTSRTHLVVQKSPIYQKKSENGEILAHPPHFSETRDI